MIKYSFEQKKALVTAYLNGEGGIRTVIKKYGYGHLSTDKHLFLDHYL